MRLRWLIPRLVIFKLILVSYCANAMTNEPPFDPQAARLFSCQKMVSILTDASIPQLHGYDSEKMAELVRRIRISTDWPKFEAVVITGSRTRFNLGAKPKVNNAGEITSDTDIQVYPSPEWFQSGDFRREWYPVMNRLVYFLVFGERRNPVIPKIEMVQAMDLVGPLSPLVRANMISSTQIEEQIQNKWNESLNASSPREEQKKFLLRELSRAIRTEKAVHTTDAIVLLRDGGPATLVLFSSLKARGFKNVLILK